MLNLGRNIFLLNFADVNFVVCFLARYADRAAPREMTPK